MTNRTMTDQLQAELGLARQRAHRADAEHAEIEAQLLEARAAALRADARSARTEAEKVNIEHTLSQVRRFCEMAVNASMRVQAVEHATDVLPVLDADPADGSPADAAWFSVWLHGNWRHLTSRMTTPQREHAADAVARYNRVLNAAAPCSKPDPLLLRWWRGER
ncbi:hypothetical protein KCMC57_64530 (plasmid) [Kitasatospora sp. CMC57]|uniref:Uncharacterized protein n=1 Tax=Kitasatospora sp. CMC57 TaxID=3231513 RepID=A0AB33KBB5_9ACTN